MKKEQKEFLKSRKSWNLQTKRSKAGVVSLYYINYQNGDKLGLKIASAAGYGYDKIESVLNEFFTIIGCDNSAYIHLGLGSSDLKGFLEANQLELETTELLEGYLIKINRKGA